MQNGNVESLLKTALGEIERVLDSRTVCGQPITVEGVTLVPLVGLGFGFGAGGGQGKTEAKQSIERANGATGGGAWIRPRAVIIIDQQKQVRIESIMDGASFAATKLGESIPAVVDKVMAKREEKKKEG